MTRYGFASRFSVFSLIGAGVFVAGLALQVALVRYGHTGPDWSYAAQAIFSIELSYLLNRFLTWRDRPVGFWASAWKFNAQKALMTVINMAAYALLVRVGMEYIVANVLLTAVFTPINYFAGDLLVFARGGRGRHGLGPGRPSAWADEDQVKPVIPEMPPTVSVVIPCKASERTIRATVDSMLAQDYPALAEVILVGDVGDSTWSALADMDDPRLTLLEQEKTPGVRDPNVKRDKGIKKSNGDVLALADSDVVVDPGWLGRAVALLHGQGGGLVAGGMRSIHDTFWGRFVDNNVLAAKTPRVAQPYRVTAENFGARGYKPPVTANAVFTRSLYDSCPLDTAWAYGYEDYEWFWRLAKGGHDILFSAELTAHHHHRRSFSQLVREYRQSAQGCAQFIRRHPDSPLSRKRTVQAFGLPLAAAGALGLAVAGVATGHGALVAGLLAIAAVIITGREVVRSGSFESLTYPPAALALGGVYAASVAGGLLLRPKSRVGRAPTWEQEPDPPPRRWWHRVSWPLTAILALQSALSLSLVWSNTVFGDEATYLSAGRLEWSHWLHGTSLPAAGQANFGFSGPFQSYFSGAPVIYPPLGALAADVGGLAAARILGLAFMLGACVCLYLTAKRLFSPQAGLFAAGMWAVAAPTLRLAFATFDPMAIFLVCLGTSLAVESGFRRRRGELIAVAGVALAVGAVTAYSYTIFVPIGIVFAVISWVPRDGWKRSIVIGCWLAGLVAALLVMVPTVLKLWPGIFSTTLSRNNGDSGILSVARTSWELTGLIAVLAVIGAISAACSRSRRSHIFLLALCAVTALLVPVEQARLETGTALDKHLALGAWFASMAAGYAASQLTAGVRWRQLAAALCAAVAILVPAVDGWMSAYNVYHLWPNAGPYIAAMRPLVAKSSGNLLVVQYPSMTEYYLGNAPNWERWTSVSLAPGNAGVPRAKWGSYYRSQMSQDSPQLIAVPFDVTFTSKAPSNLLLSNLSEFLKTGKQASVRAVLLKIAAADVSSLEPGFLAFAGAIANDPAYRVVSVTPYNSHIATGVFVIWKRVVTAHSGAAQSAVERPHWARSTAR